MDQTPAARARALLRAYEPRSEKLSRQRVQASAEVQQGKQSDDEQEIPAAVVVETRSTLQPAPEAEQPQPIGPAVAAWRAHTATVTDHEPPPDGAAYVPAHKLVPPGVSGGITPAMLFSVLLDECLRLILELGPTAPSAWQSLVTDVSASLQGALQQYRRSITDEHEVHTSAVVPASLAGHELRTAALSSLPRRSALLVSLIDAAGEVDDAAEEGWAAAGLAGVPTSLAGALCSELPPDTLARPELTALRCAAHWRHASDTAEATPANAYAYVTAYIQDVCTVRYARLEAGQRAELLNSLCVSAATSVMDRERATLVALATGQIRPHPPAPPTAAGLYALYAIVTRAREAARIGFGGDGSDLEVEQHLSCNRAIQRLVAAAVHLFIECLDTSNFIAERIRSSIDGLSASLDRLSAVCQTFCSTAVDHLDPHHTTGLHSLANAQVALMQVLACMCAVPPVDALQAWSSLDIEWLAATAAAQLALLVPQRTHRRLWSAAWVGHLASALDSALAAVASSAPGQKLSATILSPLVRTVTALHPTATPHFVACDALIAADRAQDTG